MFKKKKKGPIELKLDTDQFCRVAEEYADDVHKKYCIIANADQYNLLYCDGQYMGIPKPHGGAIYPFAKDPTEMGKMVFRKAKVVVLSKDFNLKVFWGTEVPFVLEDCITKKAFEVCARGVFYVNIDPTDAARTANQFYSKCLTQGNAEMFTADALRDFLREAFVVQIGAKIQQHMEDQQRSLENLVGVQPAEILQISEELFPKIKGIFAQFGLTITDISRGSILQGMEVRPKSAN